MKGSDLMTLAGGELGPPCLYQRSVPVVACPKSWLITVPQAGRLVEDADLDLTDFFFSSTFFFFSAGCGLKPVSQPSTARITDTRRVHKGGTESDFS